MVIFVIPALGVGVGAGCGGPAPGSAPKVRLVLHAAPLSELWDAPVRVWLTGASAGASVTLQAQTTDFTGANWTSSATFTADRRGVASTLDSSRAGSYTGVDPMGLFTLMQPSAGAVTSTVFPAPDIGYDVTVTATVDRRVVASTVVTREGGLGVGVHVTDLVVAANGLFGYYYQPATISRPRPAVLVFGGSEGHVSTVDQATMLAAHGYPALALGYFDEPGLPSSLARIPLEYFVKALRYLARQPGVNRRRLWVWGSSRGAEAALLLGAYFPGLVHGVVATSPSSVVNPGFPDSSEPAWTLGGKPLPGVPPSAVDQPNPRRYPRAVIPVGRIRGPVLLVCGGQDAVWPSCPYANAIGARLRAGFPHQLLRYPNAGHLVDAIAPYLPLASTATSSAYGLQATGGTRSADISAWSHAWPRLLAFLST